MKFDLIFERSDQVCTNLTHSLISLDNFSKIDLYVLKGLAEFVVDSVTKELDSRNTIK
jgi:hypothetical protein